MNTKIEKLNLAIACGGTGGHFFPGLTIAKTIRMRGGNAILFIGGNHIQKQIKIAESECIDTIPVPTCKIPENKLLLPLFSFKFLYHTIIHRDLINRLKINAALGMGSFASAPLGFAAKSKKIPLFLHEGNSIMGDSNRLLSKYARFVLLSFPVKNPAKMKVPYKIVGMPVRDQIINACKASCDSNNKARIKNDLNLDPVLPVLMVFGGSQGAKFINDLTQKSIRELSQDMVKFQIIHLTGQDDNHDIENLYKKKKLNFFIKKEYQNIEELIIASDLIICRAGGSTISELTALGKCALYIPLPTAKNHHQFENARIMYEQNAGYILEQKNCSPELLIKEITRWVNAKDEFDKLGKNASKLARPNAGNEIVDVIIENI